MPPSARRAVPPPVVVLAPARSCSSVFVAMLGCHPELYGFPELRLFAHDTVGALLDAPPTLASLLPAGVPWDPAPGLRRAVAEVVFGGQDAETLACAGRWLVDRRDWPTATLFTMLLEFVAPLAGVEKSPETSFDEAGPKRVLSWYPLARFVHLVRHPVSFQRSLQRMLLLFDRPDICARAWLSAHRRIAKFCAELPAGQSMLLRAEEALSGSNRGLAELARFLGVSDDDWALEQMRHPENSEYCVGGGTGLGIHWDPGFLASPALRPPVSPDSLRAPREWRVPDSIEEEIVELAESFGYT
ncbi:MAG: sulfotransferase [Solirubrobacterales bacterium]|nr:sulfotransferase [Solirubrobacterales bacterium]